jgi:hypothetical protein
MQQAGVLFLVYTWCILDSCLVVWLLLLVCPICFLISFSYCGQIESFNGDKCILFLSTFSFIVIHVEHS